MKRLLWKAIKFVGSFVIGAGLEALAKRSKADCDIKKEISLAVARVESSKLEGEDKMRRALEIIKVEAPQAAKDYTETQLRMYIEMKLNKLF